MPRSPHRAQLDADFVDGFGELEHFKSHAAEGVVGGRGGGGRYVQNGLEECVVVGCAVEDEGEVLEDYLSFLSVLRLMYRR